MRRTRRKTIEEQDGVAHRHKRLLLLWILVGISGVAGLVGFMQTQESSWPKPFAFAWCIVFATGLVIEWIRGRRAPRRADAAGNASARGRQTETSG